MHARYSKGGTSVADCRLMMQHAMQNHAAVFREQETMDEVADLTGRPYKLFEYYGVPHGTLHGMHCGVHWTVRRR